MKKIFYIFLSLVAFSSCSDIAVEVISSISSSDSSTGANLNENPAFQSELNWYKPYNADTSSYSRSHKLFPGKEGELISIPEGDKISGSVRIESFYMNNGERNSDFAEANAQLQGYRLYNNSGFQRNEIKEEVQFSNNEKIVALNLKTREIRTLALIENNSCDRVLDWKGNNYLYVRNISSPGNPDSSILYKARFGYDVDKAVLIQVENKANSISNKINQAYQVDPNTYVIEVRHGFSVNQNNSDLMIVDANGKTKFEIRVNSYGRLIPYVYDNRYMIYVEQNRAVKFDVYTGEITFEWDFESSNHFDKVIITIDKLYVSGHDKVKSLNVIKETKWSTSFHNSITGMSLHQDEIAVNSSNEINILDDFGREIYTEETPYLWYDYEVRFYNEAPVIIGNEIYNCDAYGLLKMTRP